MKGDFSRQTFNASKHFLRVLMQQGRVQLDADWNEQVAILLHYIQSLAADIIGPYGAISDGFSIGNISESKEDFTIHKGHYYVDGILCENKDEIKYSEQPDYPLTDSTKLTTTGFPYLVYLDVWERHITCIEDSEFPSIREVALNGPDTATRSQVIWQVKTMAGVGSCSAFDILIKNWQPVYRGRLKAKGKEPAKQETDPCIISPEARYRGSENQLYRVEIHRSGAAGTATFKWSRDNGSVIFPIVGISGNAVTLEHLGQDDSRSLAVGRWVELVDDNYSLGAPLDDDHLHALLQIQSVDPVEKTVVFSDDSVIPDFSIDKHPYLRLWESDAIVFTESSDANNGWFDLEDGIRIQFQIGLEGNSHSYRNGDYWLIPGRSITGDILWPLEKDEKGKWQPAAVTPHGVDHHYAPLAILPIVTAGKDFTDCRCVFTPHCPGEIAKNVPSITNKKNERSKNNIPLSAKTANEHRVNGKTEIKSRPGPKPAAKTRKR
jgi:hypothetical protein